MSAKKSRQLFIYGSDGSVKVPAFEDLKISTMTIIIHTNLTINIKKMYKYLPITDYIISKKRRGRRKQFINDNPNNFIPPGSIISVRSRQNIRGVVLKPSKIPSK